MSGSASQQSPQDRPSEARFALASASALDYMADAAQRTILFLDVMRQRGNAYREHLKETAPHVLDYEAKLGVEKVFTGCV